MASITRPDPRPRHLIPPEDQHPSWNYRLPAEHIEDTELVEEDIDMLLELAAEKLGITL